MHLPPLIRLNWDLKSNFKMTCNFGYKDIQFPQVQGPLLLFLMQVANFPGAQTPNLRSEQKKSLILVAQTFFAILKRSNCFMGCCTNKDPVLTFLLQ
jgi:hypothetical protein